MKSVRRPSPALVLSCLAVILAAGGADAIGKGVGALLKKDSVRSIHVKDGSLQAQDLSDDALADLEGDPGPRGPAGAAGAAGAGGAKGDAGAAGAKGEPGSAGPAGPTGPKGDPGTPGTNGTNGTQGPQGPSGPTGPTGPGAPSEAIDATRTGDPVAASGLALGSFGTLGSARASCRSDPGGGATTGAQLTVSAPTTGDPVVSMISPSGADPVAQVLAVNQTPDTSYLFPTSTTANLARSARISLARGTERVDILFEALTAYNSTRSCRFTVRILR